MTVPNEAALQAADSAVAAPVVGDVDAVSSLDPGVRRRAVVAMSVGNMLEYYDFAGYAVLATIIGKLFFAATDPVAQLSSAFSVFAVAFVFRPVGAVLFGWLADKVGRRSTLLIVVTIMGVATIVIGLLPTYAGIGVAAPILLVVARAAQGLSLGGEFSTSAAFLVEFAPRHRRGFYGSFTYGSAILGSAVGVALVFGLSSSLGSGAMLSYGWRIPFLLSFPLLLVGFYLRYRLSETPHFQQLRRARAPVPAGENLWTHRKSMFQVVGVMVAMATGSYILLSFMTSYLLTVLRYSPTTVYWSVIATAVFGAIVTVAFGRISDSVGRRPILVTACVLVLLFSYPAFLLLSSGPLGAWLGQFVLWFIMGMFSGAIPAAFSELFPTRYRAAGFGIAYAVATAALSGVAPLAATALIRATGSSASPGWYLTAAGLISLPVALWVRESVGKSLD